MKRPLRRYGQSQTSVVIATTLTNLDFLPVVMQVRQAVMVSDSPHIMATHRVISISISFHRKSSLREDWNLPIGHLKTKQMSSAWVIPPLRMISLHLHGVMRSLPLTIGKLSQKTCLRMPSILLSIILQFMHTTFMSMTLPSMSCNLPVNGRPLVMLRLLPHSVV